MKHILSFYGVLFLLPLLLLTSCNEAWEEHFTDQALSSTLTLEVSDRDAAQYLQATASLSKMSALYQQSGWLDRLSGENACTLVLCQDDSIHSTDVSTLSHEKFVANTVSSIAVAPASLKEGYGIYMQSGKNVWVSMLNDELYFNGKKVLKTVRVRNGYIYYVEQVIPVQQSVYEYIQLLGEDYSLFKQYIAFFEERYFDAAASIPSGTDAMGNTIYSDSVISTRNTLMDRYTETGLTQWNMQSEAFQSTVFIPNNDLLRAAYENALDSIPVWMNRAATAADSLKFKKWVVSSFFVNRRLNDSEVSASAQGQFSCVGGCIREIDETTDTEKYTNYEAAQWKPSVQKVDAQHGVQLSNGVAYFLTDYKIPNHVVIWRAKARFYEVWAALTEKQTGWNVTDEAPMEGGYFRWHDWMKPAILLEAQGPFELSSTLPTITYNVLTAEPSAEARANNRPVSVDCDGLMYNTDRAFGLAEAHLPAGEYYLRMGFKHSLTYSISIYFCGEDEEFGENNRLVEDMSLIATGSNFHFDRGGAMEGLDFYGSESLGYPEYYDWRWWYNQDPVQYQKASAYDTDGYQVGVVNLKHSGNFKIKIESNDNARLYGNGNQNRTKSDVAQLMMYHWCLRPTINNY